MAGPDLEQFRATVTAVFGIEDTKLSGHSRTLVPPQESTPSDVRGLVAALPRFSTAPGDGGTGRELALGQTLGSGGMGRVRLAEQIPLGREVAVKSSAERSDPDRAALALLREAWITGWLEHPNIVPIYTLGVDSSNQPLIVMKRIEGTPWSSYTRGEKKPPLRAGETELDFNIHKLIQLCHALAFAAEKGVVHRDIKPDNVMIGRFGEVYLVDWGIAVSLEDSRGGRLPLAANARALAGTPGYMAPEMVDERPGRHLDHRTDVYLLGACLHEVLTGSPPHAGQTMVEALFRSFVSKPPDYPDTVPHELAEIARRAMARAPADRYASATEFREALEGFLAHQSSTDITREAEQQLRTLRAHAQQTELDSRDAVAIHASFGACRFGFQRALESWPDNPNARAGLDEALHTMIRFEIDRENFDNASALYSELSEADESLRTEIETLGRKIQEAERELAALRSARDLTTAWRTRSFLTAATAFLWAGAPFAAELGARAGMPLTYEMLWVAYFGLAVLMVALIFWARESLRKTTVNLQYTRGLCIIGVGILIGKAASQAFGVEAKPSIVLDMLLLGSGLGLLGLQLDRRLLGVGALYGIATCIAIGWPQQSLIIIGTTHIIGLGGAAFLWRSEAPPAHD